MSDCRIMVIEANGRIGRLVCNQLRKKHYDAVHVHHGAEAALHLRQQRCDAILLDSKVPMGGVRTARLLRLHPQYGQIPPIHLLPPDKRQASAIMAEAKAFHFDHFLPKPFTPDDLQRSLRQVLDPNTPRPQVPEPEQIRAEIRSLSQLPVMPDSHTKLLQLLGKPDEAVDLNLVAKTVELDPALTLKVMRICRSAFFGFQGDGMLQALIFLGIENIRQIVQSALVTSVFTASNDRSAAFTMQDLWRHSLATGLVMAALDTGDKKSLYFMTGLLHDVGKAIFHFRFPDYFAHAVELAANECIPLIQAERELFGITHAQCGGELASHWHLPSEIHTGIIAHHKPAIATKSRRLAALVHLADIAVRQMGIGSGGDSLIPSVDPLAKRLIPALRPIFERRDALVEQVDSILGPDTEH